MKHICTAHKHVKDSRLYGGRQRACLCASGVACSDLGQSFLDIIATGPLGSDSQLSVSVARQPVAAFSGVTNIKVILIDTSSAK